MRSRHMLPIFLAGGLLTTGCTSRSRVAEEMQAALARTNDGLGVALAALEPASYAIDPESTLDDGYRHPASGPCPSNEHDTADPDLFVTELDYGDGCLPRSGLMPTIVADAASLGWDAGGIEITYGGVLLALSNAVEGSATGAVEAQGVDERVTLDADLVIASDEQALTATAALTALLTPDTLELDGEVHLGSGEVVWFDGVRLPYDAIRGECPTPTAGTVTITGGDEDLVVDLAAPGEGDVTVTRGGRVSDPASLCGFDTWLFNG